MNNYYCSSGTVRETLLQSCLSSNIYAFLSTDQYRQPQVNYIDYQQNVKTSVLVVSYTRQGERMKLVFRTLAKKKKAQLNLLQQILKNKIVNI